MGRLHLLRALGWVHSLEPAPLVGGRPNALIPPRKCARIVRRRSRRSRWSEPRMIGDSEPPEYPSGRVPAWHASESQPGGEPSHICSREPCGRVPARQRSGEGRRSGRYERLSPWRCRVVPARPASSLEPSSIWSNGSLGDRRPGVPGRLGAPISERSKRQSPRAIRLRRRSPRIFFVALVPT